MMADLKQRKSKLVRHAAFSVFVLLFGLLFAPHSLPAQKPTDPALMVGETAPLLDAIATRVSLDLPNGEKLGPPAAVAFNSKRHRFVLNRGPHPIAEFDERSAFLRAFGEGLFQRPHGLRIDRDDNIWATDVEAHVVLKFNPSGQLVMTIGSRGEAGVWDESAGSRKLNQPTDLLIAPNGDILVAQGHTPGLTAGGARILKFDKTGRFLMAWGAKGAGPSQFQVPHSLALDPSGRLWVADRENQRFQIFDLEGKLLATVHYKGLPCSFFFRDGNVFIASGYAAQLVRMDLEGHVLAATGKSGAGVGEFGEAHSLALGPAGEIYVSDTINSTLQRFDPRP